MIYRSILACLLCVVAFSPAAGAEEQVETLEQLRQRYQQARDIVAKTEKPALGSEGFHEQLKVWAEAYQRSQESARALIPALLNHWLTLPDDSAEAKTVRQEIKTVCKDMAGHPRSEQYNNTILHDKVSINHKVNPAGSLDYGPETGEARYRNYIDYLQLCEILHGLQAAIVKDHASATQRIQQARKLRDVLSPEAGLLIAELGRRAEADED